MDSLLIDPHIVKLHLAEHHKSCVTTASLSGDLINHSIGDEISELIPTVEKILNTSDGETLKDTLANLSALVQNYGSFNSFINCLASKFIKVLDEIIIPGLYLFINTKEEKLLKMCCNIICWYFGLYFKQLEPQFDFKFLKTTLLLETLYQSVTIINHEADKSFTLIRDTVGIIILSVPETNNKGLFRWIVEKEYVIRNSNEPTKHFFYAVIQSAILKLCMEHIKLNKECGEEIEPFIAHVTDIYFYNWKYFETEIPNYQNIILEKQLLLLQKEPHKTLLESTNMNKVTVVEHEKKQIGKNVPPSECYKHFLEREKLANDTQENSLLQWVSIFDTQPSVVHSKVTETVTSQNKFQFSYFSENENNIDNGSTQLEKTHIETLNKLKSHWRKWLNKDKKEEIVQHGKLFDWFWNFYYPIDEDCIFHENKEIKKS